MFEAATGSDFICDCEDILRSACVEQPFYKKHQSKQYCVLHYPGVEKSADFEKAFRRKIEANDFNFRGVWFPGDVDLSGVTFHVSVDFLKATFNEKMNFSNARFKEDANFGSVTFR